jgi:hypothetical protein
MDDSNFASLSPTLLARKGGAKPAMRPQHAPLTNNTAAQSLEDLGWNDMGADDDAPKHDNEVAHLTPAPSNPDMEAEAHELDQQAEAALTISAPAKPEVHRQQEVLSESLAETFGAELVEPTHVPELVPEAALEQTDVETLIVKKSKPAAHSDNATSGLSRPRRSAIQRGKRAAFTLRLDADRHLKLRLACTLRGRSAQQLVTEALDDLLGDMPDVDSLAAQVRT